MLKRTKQVRGWLHLPVWVAEMGKVLLGAGVGAWLAWAGAVSDSFPPHQLHYWAGPSLLATVAIVGGAMLWVVAAHDDARIAILQREVDALHEHLRESHVVNQLLASKPTTGMTGPAGPLPGPGNATWQGSGRSAMRLFGRAYGTVLPPPIVDPPQDAAQT